MPPRPPSNSPLAPQPLPNRRTRTGLSYYSEKRLKAQLRKTTPSEPWVEAQLKSALLTDDAGQPHIHRYHDQTVFPPGGPQTAMRTCPLCHIPNPPQAFDGNQCLDHAENLDEWGSSPSAVAIQMLQYYNLREEETKLPPEDYHSLQREITRYFVRKSKRRTRARKS